MGCWKRLRILLGILKDEGSLIKTTLSTNQHQSSVRRVIIRATSHGSPSPPSDERMAEVIAFGEGSPDTARVCIQSLIDRLHNTSNVSVALKCLLAVHNIIEKGSFILKEQLSFSGVSEGRNFLNLSMFRDNSDMETWETSNWVRWYAEILEQNLIISRILGHHLYNHRINKDKVLASSNSGLLIQINALVTFVELLANPPNSLHLQENSLVYEVVNMVSQNYRLIQQEISVRVEGLGTRLMSLSLSLSECDGFLNTLHRFEDCKEGMRLLLANRNRNDELWDLVKETKVDVAMTIEEKKNGRKLLAIDYDGRQRHVDEVDWVAF